MSAIWGYIDFSGNKNLEDSIRINNVLKKGYADCKIDRYGDYVADSFCLGCGIQYFTPEAEKEILPIVDEEKGIYFTADAIIDNREELLPKIGFKADDTSIPDARILYEMFSKYGESCLNDILGVYTFVYYNKFKNVCYIINDAVGYRTLQYYYEENKLIFSTLIMPICGVLGSAKTNTQWFLDFVSMDNLAIIIDCESTPVMGIKRLFPATSYKFSVDGIKKNRYWEPKTSDLKLKSDNDYKELFVQTYKEAVNRVIRDEKLTLLLSGGLDSTSIVCMLPNTKKGACVKLRTYTSVPFIKFKRDMSIGNTEDESEEVLRTKEFLHNRGFDFDTQFLTLDDVNVWTAREDKEKVLEMPYKPVLNLLWIGKALSESYDYGARIMLIGAYGNCGVSLGIGDMYLYGLLHQKKYLGFIKECKALGDYYNVSLRQNLRKMIAIYKRYRKLPLEYKKKQIAAINPMMSDAALEKYSIQERLDENLNNQKTNRGDFTAYKKRLFNEAIFYNLAEIHTKESLSTGTVLRDPTLDKRVIELCCRLPASSYAKDGLSRRLVREYLKEIMPDNARNMFYHGVQSADLRDRVIDDEKFFDEIHKTCKKYDYLGIIDSNKVEAEIERIKGKGKDTSTFEICRLEYTAMALEMIHKIENFT